MKGLYSARLQAWFSYVVLRLGAAGFAGVLMLSGCGVAAVVLSLRTDRATNALRIAQARSDLQRLPTAAPPTLTAQTFVARLPAAEQVPVFIEALHRQAERARLQIERAEYRTPTLAGGRVLRSQVVLPLTGSYPDIGRWLGLVLSQHPSAAIDEFSLQRDTVGDAVRARVVLSHYSRIDP